MLLGCNVYISEGRNLAILQKLKEVAQAQQRAACLQTFSDEPYNRTSFTLAARLPGQLANAAVSLAREALQLVHLGEHTASHPRVGTVDHISCHPFSSEAPLAAADETAQLIGEQLGQSPGLPVFLYGTAHSHARQLPRLRRELGYFAGGKTGTTAAGRDPAAGADWAGIASAGEWSGWGSSVAGSLKIAPDYGPDQARPNHGVSLVGSGLWVTNFNVLLLTQELRRAQQISTLLSERGGGLLGVQAMALPHQDGIEVACNLVNSGQKHPDPDEVKARVRQLATEQSIPVGNCYRIGKSLQELIEEANAQLPEES
ncbi:hypothetical protein WJX74_007324 [Apatococcus lobatus]|uniref:Formiminotransferase N-terminal subdomain domain-containing protein n=1 Tax=Apatococcus lobatus TaxID=904363 RepID=A0AAW1SAN6_9CHLO